MKISSELSSIEVYGQRAVGCGEACLLAAHAILMGEPCKKRENFENLHSALSVRFKKPNPPRDYSDLKEAADVLGVSAKVLSMSEFWQFSGLRLVRLRWGHEDAQPPEPGARFPVNFMYDREHYVLVYAVGGREVHFWEPSFGWQVGERRNLSDEQHWLGTGTPFWKMSGQEFESRNMGLKEVPSASGYFLGLGGLGGKYDSKKKIWTLVGLVAVAAWLLNNGVKKRDTED